MGGAVLECHFSGDIRNISNFSKKDTELSRIILNGDFLVQISLLLALYQGDLNMKSEKKKYPIQGSIGFY